KPGNEDARETNEPSHQPAAIHDLPGKHEERNGHEPVLLDAAEELLGNRRKEDVIAGDLDIGESRDEQQEGDGHTEDQEQDEHRDRHSVTRPSSRLATA